MKRVSILILMTLAHVTQAFSYSECTREVVNFYTQMDSSELVWVTFKQGASIYKGINSPPGTTAGNVNKLMSIVMTAQSTGKKVTVRYPENNMTCPPAGSARNDFVGIWLLK